MRRFRKARSAARRPLFGRRRRVVRRRSRMGRRTPFPVKQVVYLNYTQIQPVNRVVPGGGGTLTSNYYFATNSIFDPDQTTSGSPGHQPYYHDQLIGIYSHYSVLSATATMTAISGGPFVFFGSIQDTIELTDTFTAADLERPGVKMCVPTGTRPGKVTLRWNCKTAALDRYDNTGQIGNAGTGSDPPKLRYFRFGASIIGTPGGGDITTNYQPNAVVRIRYKVMLTTPLKLGTS